MKPFVSPHVHIQSLDSASTPANFVKRELELGTGALVVTDHGTLIACQQVYELGKKNGLTPVLGIEGYMRDDNCPIFEAAGIQKNEEGTHADYFKYGHFCAHFMDQDAYTTCIRLLSKAPTEQHGSEVKPLFNWQDMEELGATNTTITSGCLIGVVARHLLKNNDPVMAEAYYKRLRSIVKPGNFFVEAFPNVCTHNYVKGIFVTLKRGEGEPFVLRFWEGKTLKTNVGELKANALAAAYSSKGNKHSQLIAVKDRQAWVEQEPADIVAIEHRDGFFENECTDWCPDGDVQLGVNRFMVELARKYGDPVHISDDAHHATPDEKIVQNVRLAASGWSPFFGSYHRKSSEDAWDYFSKRMGTDEKTFDGWIENSREWLTRFKEFKLEYKTSLPTKFYETKYAEVGAANSLEYTLHLIKKHGRFIEKPEYRARLNAEIKLLYKNGVIDLLPYFMIDEEVCALYTQHKMLTGPGRGSAAGLLLAYYLGITHVDPIRYGLSLDRFLTLDRIKSGKLPDIDQDLGSRELLVGEDGSGGWLKERFGDHVAQISTVTTLRLSSSVKDVARFQLGSVPKDISDMAHKFMKPPQGLEDHKFVFGYEDSDNEIPGSITFDQSLIKYAKMYPEQWSITQKVLGLGRGVSRHACAYAFSNYPIGSFIPLTKISGVTCTQFTAAAVEAAGALKMDFLVINSLNDIANAILMVQNRSGLQVPEEGMDLDGKWVPSIQLIPIPGKNGFADIWDLPEDQAVFGDIARSNTETVFQFSTPGAIGWLKHFAHKKENGHHAIDSIETLAAFTALDRPGPLDALVVKPGAVPTGEYEPAPPTKASPGVIGDHELEGVPGIVFGPRPGTRRPIYNPADKHNMLVEYAHRARGKEPSPDIFPIFDRLFPETYGIMVYQEQLQRLYQEVTGCTGAEAEEFRSNVAKKRKEKIIAAYPSFIEGATKVLGSQDSAEAVWQFIQSWAAYGFNKSHAVCYVIIAYACAYLKHHYPLEWWTGVLRNADKDEINEKFWKYCGHLINLPDVTSPCKGFEIVSERIQAPLSLLLGIGPAAHTELVAGAPYASMDDFVKRINDKKLAGATTKIVVDKKTGENKEKVVLGRSALHSGIVDKLIISGAMDKLFSPDTDTLSMLEGYRQAAFDAEQAARKKPSKTKVRKPVPKEFLNLTQLTRYQLRKQILPAYSEPVLKILVQRKHESIYIDGRRARYRWGGRGVPFVSQAEMQKISNDPLPENGLRVAAAVYVSDVRCFEFGPKNAVGVRETPKTACEVIVDFDGVRMKFVKWPDFETEILDKRFNPSLKDSIAILVLSKFKEIKPFGIDDIEVVQPAPSEVQPDPEPEESP